MELSVSSDRKTMGLFIHASVSPPLTRSLLASADVGGIYRLVVTPIRCYLGIRKPITIELSKLKTRLFPSRSCQLSFSARCDPPPPLFASDQRSPPGVHQRHSALNWIPVFDLTTTRSGLRGGILILLPLAPGNHSAQDGVQSPKTLHLLMVQV